MGEFIETKQQTLPLLHGALAFPAFLPDATLGVVRGTDADDLRAAGVRALVMNVFHLMQKPGSSTISALACRNMRPREVPVDSMRRLNPEVNR